MPCSRQVSVTAGTSLEKMSGGALLPGGTSSKRSRHLSREWSSGLRQLDIVSLDDLACRVGLKRIDELVGSLHDLSKASAVLLEQIQTNGRPRDLAEERWILELADIYENAFRQPASVWRVGVGPVRGRGGFYRFLELSRPKQFPRHGKLHPRQVDRLLKQRRRQPRDSCTSGDSRAYRGSAAAVMHVTAKLF